MPRNYALIIPALDEEDSVADVLKAIPAGLFSEVLVVDNGSRDRTAEVAEQAGARVVRERRRGYGQACQAGLRALGNKFDAVAFIGADLSDDPADLTALVCEYEAGGWDLVMGSRVLGHAELGALLPLQRFGNALATQLIRWIWDVRFTDLGPLRLIRREALGRLGLRDPDFGWTVEMQAKAARLALRMKEIPASYRSRRVGKSKISGTFGGSVRAGWKILWTIYRSWRGPTGTRSGADASRALDAGKN